jgi:hypothetical protein
LHDYSCFVNEDRVSEDIFLENMCRDSHLKTLIPLQVDMDNLKKDENQTSNKNVTLVSGTIPSKYDYGS